MEERITFGKFIIKKRKENNLTQKELAEKLYVTESAVSKWERGVSYPDITLVASICEILEISEHELITASEDFQQREIEKQAKKFRHITKAYAWVFYLSYGIALVTCFICNLAIDHKLSWFFIVLTAVMVAFSLTSLPGLIKEKKGMITIVSLFLTLNLLLFTCSVYLGGDWFFVTFISLLFGFAVVFLPLFIREIPLPYSLHQHKTLLCFVIDTVLLIALIAVACGYNNSMGQFFTVGLPVTLLGALWPWLIMITIRYIKANALFRTAICFLISGIYHFLINPLINAIIDKRPFALQEYNLQVWTINYVNGNISLIILAVCIVAAAIFTVGGIALMVKKK